MRIKINTTKPSICTAIDFKQAVILFYLEGVVVQSEFAGFNSRTAAGLSTFPFSPEFEGSINTALKTWFWIC